MHERQDGRVGEKEQRRAVQDNRNKFREEKKTAKRKGMGGSREVLSRLPKSICAVVHPLEGVVELEYLGDFCYQVDGKTLESIVAGDSLLGLGDLEHENNTHNNANSDDW